MIMDNRPIGIFDSGIGGVTVLKQLLSLLPNEDFIYLGDTSKLPYGNKTEDEIKQYSNDCVRFLISQNVKLIVMACNTSSNVSYDYIKQKNENIILVRMYRPATIDSITLSENKVVGVIATPATVGNPSYLMKLKSIEKEYSIKVLAMACPKLVPIVESNLNNSELIKSSLSEYINPLVESGIDSLILGCTHYPFLSEAIKEIYPNLRLIDPGYDVALFTQNKLEELNLSSSKEVAGSVKVFLSGSSTNFKKLAEEHLDIKLLEPEIVQIHSN